LQCVILENELLSNIDDKTTILCIHCIDVKNYNNLVLQKLFTSNKTFDVLLSMNASKFAHMQQWIKDPHFEHIKKVVVGALVFITKNIDMSKGVVNGAMAIVTFINFDDNKKYQI
jgi:hypothetical protein